MFGLRKGTPNPPPEGEVVASQPPGEVFPWPKGAVLTAVDEVVLQLPIALFDKDKPMGDFLVGSEGMEVNIPPKRESFLIRLRPGMSAQLGKSVEARVIADDAKPRRIMVKKPPAQKS